MPGDDGVGPWYAVLPNDAAAIAQAVNFHSGAINLFLAMKFGDTPLRYVEVAKAAVFEVRRTAKRAVGARRQQRLPQEAIDGEDLVTIGDAGRDAACVTHRPDHGRACLHRFLADKEVQAKIN